MQESMTMTRGFDVVVLPVGTPLYRQSPSPDRCHVVCHSQPLTWFALWPDYGESYGDFEHEYTAVEPLYLLNVSTEDMRDNVGLDDSCDEQYSGCAANAEAHEVLMPLLRGLDLDGTIIVDGDDADTHGLSVVNVTDDECEGPTEVMLLLDAIRNKLD